MTTAEWANQLYVDALQRSAEPAAVANIVKLVDTMGVSKQQVALGVLKSLEARERQAIALYQQLLGRGIDGPALTSVVAYLQGGGDIATLASFVMSSQEYNVRVRIPPP